MALGAALGVVGGVGLFLATVILLLQPGQPVGPTLSLLGNYLLGFEASWGGALLGLVEAGAGGFAIGYVVARAINLLVAWHELKIRRRLELTRTLDPLEGLET